MSVFQNSRPKLLGVDTHEAVLNGDAVLDIFIDEDDNIITDTDSERPRDTKSVLNDTYLFPQNILTVDNDRVILTYFFLTGSNNANFPYVPNNPTIGAATHSLQRDGVEIASFNNGNYDLPTYVNKQFIDTPPPGTHNYTVKITAINGELIYQHISLFLNKISIIDTHMVALNGNNSHVSLQPNNIFPNSRPKLLGEDTHEAVLSRDDAVLDIFSDKVKINAANGGNKNIIQQFHNADFVPVHTVTTTTSNERVILIYVMFTGILETIPGGGAATHSLQRDGVEIASFNNNNYSNSISISEQFIDTPPPGTHNYTVKITAINIQWKFEEQKAFLFLNKIDIIDTHTVELTGDNTQRTKESEVLP